MTDQKLALALVQAGLLTAPQIHSAASQRTGGKDLAQVILDNGWLSSQELARFTNSNGALKSPAADTQNEVKTQVGLGQDGPVYMGSGGVVLDGDEEESEDDEESSEAVQMANQLLQQAVAMRASDLHLQPERDGLLPRFRVDGALTAGRLIPRELQPSVTSRIKLMAHLNIAETRVSQDGRFKAKVGGKPH